MDEQVDQPRKDPRLGRLLLQQYRLETAIGEGGMGAVYRGQQLSVGRPVAVKLIAGKIAENPECVKRFRREAEAMAKLHHPNTVRLFDFGVADEGELFMVMELLEGADLSEQLTRRGRLPPGEALDITRQVLEALSEAHALGIVHRDLKPANVFLAQVPGGRSVVKVMDFGIAGIEQGGAGTKLTMTGAVMGTPAYMSPEQAQGKPVDARSDLYSLGVMLFEMLIGKPPFEADSAVSLLLAQVSTPPPRLLAATPGVAHAAGLQAFLDALLDKNPERRPASAQEALARVEELTRQLDPTTAKSLLPLLASSGAPPALAQTTFSRGTLSALPRPARGKWLALAGAAAAAAIAAIALWPAARTPASAPPPAPVAAPPPGPGANVMYSVHIVSKPAGAGVQLAGVEIGKTPYTLQFRQPTAITLALPGYQDRWLEVDAQTEPNLVVALEPATVAQQRSRRGKSDHADVPARPPAAPPLQAAGAPAPQPSVAPEPATPPPVVAAAVTPAARPPQAAPAPLPPPASVSRPAPVMSARDRREAMLRSGPPVRNVASAKQAYRAGQLSEDAYEDVIWVLKTQRKRRIEAEKLNYKRGLISRDEYERRVARIDYEYEGR